MSKRNKWDFWNHRRGDWTRINFNEKTLWETLNEKMNFFEISRRESTAWIEKSWSWKSIEIGIWIGSLNFCRLRLTTAHYSSFDWHIGTYNTLKNHMKQPTNAFRGSWKYWIVIWSGVICKVVESYDSNCGLRFHSKFAKKSVKRAACAIEKEKKWSAIKNSIEMKMRSTFSWGVKSTTTTRLGLN